MLKVWILKGAKISTACLDVAFQNLSLPRCLVNEEFGGSAVVRPESELLEVVASQAVKTNLIWVVIFLANTDTVLLTKTFDAGWEFKR